MERIDLSTNSKKIQESYSSVVAGSKDFVVYSVDKSSALAVEEAANGLIQDFVDLFVDGKIQFGLVKVEVPGSSVVKNLLLGWCPDNSPAKSRLSFAANFAEVSRVLSGYHVQITARDQDDLNVDDLLSTVKAAAGASYTGSLSGSAAKPAPAPAVKPVVAKPVSKPVAPKPASFVPKSTGKPVAPVIPKAKLPVPSVSKFSPAKSNDDDGWGGEKEIEERDFEKNPLQDVPSAYKPTKVNIEELRKQKSDTVSSNPTPFQGSETKSNDDASEPKSLADRMATYKSNEEDGRLTSLPKPKITNSVASRYTPVASSGPTFGAKPSFGTKVEKSKVESIGAASRDFASQDGKTPAQIWAEKRGQYKVVKESDDSDLAKDFAEKANVDDNEAHVVKPSNFKPVEQEEEPPVTKPAFGAPSEPSLPIRNLPPPPVRQVPVAAKEEEEQQEDEDEEEQEQEQPQEDEQEEEEEPAPTLPARSVPEPPTLPSRNEPVSSEQAAPEAESVTATAEYDYEKDDDNEIGFEEGDKIVEIDFVDKEWWSGKHLKTGEVGLFPAAYVVLDKEASEKTTPSETNEASTETNAESTKADVQAIAEYDYEKDEDNEISFAEGDLIVEIDFIDDDWWSGKHSKTQEVGLFPANYVKLKN